MHTMKKSWIPNPVRREVSVRDKGVCQHCNKRATSIRLDRFKIPKFLDENGKPYELDHIIPERSGGLHTPNNLVLSCQNCNRSKAIKNHNEAERLISEWS